MFDCCCFLNGGFFFFLGYFSMPPAHPTLASRALEGLHQLWALSWLFLITYFCQAFLSLVLSGFFYSQVFSTLHSSSTFLHICDSDASQNTKTKIFLYICCHRFIYSSYGMALNYYWCCSCRTIIFSMALLSYKV